MGGANLAARYRIGEGVIGARGVADLARSGDRIGMDVYGERTLETRFVLQARTGVWHWNDKYRPDRDAANFGYVLGAGYKMFPRSMILVDFQHDMNRIAGQRFRAMLWLAYAEGSSHKEIATVLGVKTASVKLLLFRARRRLAGLLGRPVAAKGGA